MDPIAELQPVDEPWVWTSHDLKNSDDWVVKLDDEVVDEIGRALDGIRRRGLAFEDVKKDDFPLPTGARKLAKVRESLSNGLGLSLVRGLPFDRYGQDDLAMILWGLGTHVGTGVSQSYRGDLIGEVMDMTHTGDARRAYRSPRPLDLHIDLVDVVGLLCIRQAKAGGASLVASSFAVYNSILRERPDLMPALCRGYHYRHSEASSTGEPPTSPHRVPVFGEVGGKLACNFNSSPISRSFREDDDIVNDATALEAFDYFIQTAARDEFLYRMMLEPGDLQFLNNRTTLHGRDEFEDFEELDRKRLMLRVWLVMEEWVPLPAHMRPRESEGGIPKKADALG